MVTPTVQRPSFIAAALLVVVGISRIVFAADVPSQSLAAQQVVHLLDYVGADYGGAVAGGQVVNEKELAEQIEVLAEAARLAEKLKPASGAFVPKDAVTEVKRLVEAHRSEAEVSGAAKGAANQFVAFFDLVQAPRQAPLRERGKQLYEQHCAACHGIEGK